MSVLFLLKLSIHICISVRNVPRTLNFEDTLKIDQWIFSYVSVSKIKIDNYLQD